MSLQTKAVNVDYTKLSKVVSHALRHEPTSYDLILDKDGWVEIDNLLVSLRKKRKAWSVLSRIDLERMIETSDKKRHQINDNRIRAVYGHSILTKIKKEGVRPPSILFHGTTIDKTHSIFSDGLKPMKRQYVHLSEKIEDAQEVALRRKGKDIQVLSIEAEKAYLEDILFFKEDGAIWLADHIPPEFIKAL